MGRDKVGVKELGGRRDEVVRTPELEISRGPRGPAPITGPLHLTLTLRAYPSVLAVVVCSPPTRSPPGTAAPAGRAEAETTEAWQKPN